MELERYWEAFLLSHPQHRGSGYVEAFAFGNTARMADKLAALVVSGKKTATSGLLWMAEHEHRPRIGVGDLSIVLDGAAQPMCIIETIDVQTVLFRDVDDAFARDYGEGERVLAWWQAQMWDYYRTECAQLGREPTQDMPLICERFRVVYPEQYVA